MGSNTRHPSNGYHSARAQFTAEMVPCSDLGITRVWVLNLKLMKKYICILAGAALLAACEQKTETVTPAASPSGTTSTDTSTSTTTTTTTSPAATATP